MDALDREAALRAMLKDLISRGDSVEVAAEVIKNNLEAVTEEESKNLVNILKEGLEHGYHAGRRNRHSRIRGGKTKTR